MQHRVIDAKDVVIRFAGDSGDGMQLTGTLFANLSAVYGNGLSTFPRSGLPRGLWQVSRVSRYISAAARSTPPVISATCWWP